MGHEPVTVAKRTVRKGKRPVKKSSMATSDSSESDSSSDESEEFGLSFSSNKSKAVAPAEFDDFSVDFSVDMVYADTGEPNRSNRGTDVNQSPKSTFAPYSVRTKVESSSPKRSGSVKVKRTSSADKLKMVGSPTNGTKKPIMPVKTSDESERTKSGSERRRSSSKGSKKKRSGSKKRRSSTEKERSGSDRRRSSTSKSSDSGSTNKKKKKTSSRRKSSSSSAKSSESKSRDKGRKKVSSSRRKSSSDGKPPLRDGLKRAASRSRKKVTTDI